MTSTLDMNSTLSNNLKLLAQRFPSLGERLCNTQLNLVQTTKAQDGGICYVKKGEDNRWHALSNSTDPIQKAQVAVTKLEDRIGKGLAPAVVIGLNPGYTLEILFTHFKENYYDKYIPRRIYVIVDSLECLYSWLKDNDRSDILNQQEIEFYWHQEVKRIVRQCKKDEQRSHLFIPISTLPEPVSMKLIEPLAEFFISRQEEEEILYKENCEYYQSQSDENLDKVISGKANRKPRMLIPSHASSTVVQYSVRDTKAMFEKEGWEVHVMHMQTDLSRWRINKNINDFKPDIYLLVNHLRTEDTSFYPPEMMFITWVQDTVSYINNSENATIWNDHVKPKKKRRDLLIGYVGQVKEYGYQEDRLSECPMIVNQDIFKARELTAEEKAKYECDICFASNRSKETSLIVKDDLAPKLEKFGFTEDILMTIHDHLWEYYRDENTCVGYIQLEDKIIELPEVCTIIEKLINKDDHDFVIQRIYWELNDVIYRHIVLEWIDEMGDKKINLYGRGWEKHPKFSKYAKGILNHGEELSLAYQSAKRCLHLNSLEGDHQRLNEIIDAKGNPLTRLSLDEEYLDRQKQILKGFEDFNKPNIHFINTLWNTSKTTFDKYPKSKFHEKLNEAFSKQIKNINIKLSQEPFSFSNKTTYRAIQQSQNQNIEIVSLSSQLHKKIIKDLTCNKINNTEELFPIEITKFIYKILEGKKYIYLPQFSSLETNLFCKTIQFPSNKELEKIYKFTKKKISPQKLIPELIPNYIKLKILSEDKNGIEDLIKTAYKKHPQLCDLNYAYALEKSSEENTEYRIAIKDLAIGKMSIQAAAHLVTMSTKWANEEQVVSDILQYAHKLQNQPIADPIHYLSIFSQYIKVFGVKKLSQLMDKLLILGNKEKIKQSRIAALSEHSIPTKNTVLKALDSIEIYALILKNEVYNAEKKFNARNHVIPLIQYALNASKREQNQAATKIYNFLINNSSFLNKYQINCVLKQSREISEDYCISLIKTLYLQRDDLEDLYFNSLAKPLSERGDLMDLCMLDLLEGKASFSTCCNLLSSPYPLSKRINLKDLIKKKFPSLVFPKRNNLENLLVGIFYIKDKKINTKLINTESHTSLIKPLLKLRSSTKKEFNNGIKILLEYFKKETKVCNHDSALLKLEKIGLTLQFLSAHDIASKIFEFLILNKQDYQIDFDFLKNNLAPNKINKKAFDKINDRNLNNLTCKILYYQILFINNFEKFKESFNLLDDKTKNKLIKVIKKDNQSDQSITKLRILTTETKLPKAAFQSLLFIFCYRMDSQTYCYLLDKYCFLYNPDYHEKVFLTLLNTERLSVQNVSLTDTVSLNDDDCQENVYQKLCFIKLNYFNNNPDIANNVWNKNKPFLVNKLKWGAFAFISLYSYAYNQYNITLNALKEWAKFDGFSLVKLIYDSKNWEPPSNKILELKDTIYPLWISFELIKQNKSEESLHFFTQCINTSSLLNAKNKISILENLNLKSIKTISKEIAISLSPNANNLFISKVFKSSKYLNV